METAKAAEDSAQAAERDRKVQKVRKGARVMSKLYLRV